MWMDPFARAIELITDDAINMAQMASLMRATTAPGHGPHRSSGTRAHRQWKRRRAAGITKRVRS